MKLKQLIKEYNLKLSKNNIYECQEFFRTNVDKNNKKKLINDLQIKGDTKWQNTQFQCLKNQVNGIQT